MLTLAMAAPPDAPAPPWLGGDELDALRPLVRSVVAGMLRRRRDDPDVDDCEAEVLRRAIEGRTRLRPGEPLRPWLLGIARHVALDMLRARSRELSRRAESDLDEASSSPFHERVADDAPVADQALEQAQANARVHEALRRLSVREREVLEMFHLQGLSYREIGAQLDVPMGTVCTWVSRARRALAQALEEAS